MNIKQSIGDRITYSRKQLGITIKELAARTKTLSAGRISNWEQGTRNPGPAEAKLIAEVLGVSPSYILCLSDDPRGDLHIQSEILPKCVPVSPLNKAHLSKSELQEIIKKLTPFSENIPKVFLEEKSNLIAGPNTFATIIEDTSMSPDFNVGDIVIADPDKKPKPGQYVIAHIKSSKENVIRKYRESDIKSSTKETFELVALNQDWRTIQINSQKDGSIIAILIEHRRFL